jgi:hypothetical protein
MAMMGLSTEVCGEILERFRSQLTGISDELLKELAENYALDATADIDPNDICKVLAIPGPRLVLRGSFSEDCRADQSLKSIFDEAAENVDFSAVAGVLVLVRMSPGSKVMKVFSAVGSSLSRLFHPEVSTGWAVYEHHPPQTVGDVLVVLSGIGTAQDFKR